MELITSADLIEFGLVYVLSDSRFLGTSHLLQSHLSAHLAGYEIPNEIS